MFKHSAVKIFDYAAFIEIILGNNIQAQHKALEYVFTNRLVISEQNMLAKAIAEKTETIKKTDPLYPAILFLHGLIYYLCGDYVPAFTYFQRSAELGYFHAYIQVGMMYQTAKGTKQNFAMAVHNIERGLSISNEKQLRIPEQIKLWVLSNLYNGYFQENRNMFTEKEMRPMRLCYDREAANDMSRLFQNDTIKNLLFSLDYLDFIHSPILAPHVQSVKKQIFNYVRIQIIPEYLGKTEQSADEKRKNLYSKAVDLPSNELKHLLLLLKRYAEQANVSEEDKKAVRQLVSLDLWARDPQAANALRCLAEVEPVAKYWLGKCYVDLMREIPELNNNKNRALARTCFLQAQKSPTVKEAAESMLLTLDLMEEDLNEISSAVPLADMKNGKFSPKLFPGVIDSNDTGSNNKADIIKRMKISYPELDLTDVQKYFAQGRPYSRMMSKF